MGSACSTVDSTSSRTGNHLTDGSSSNNPLLARGSSMDSRAVGVMAQPLHSGSTAATAASRNEHTNRSNAPQPRRFMLLSVGSPVDGSAACETGGSDDHLTLQHAPNSGSTAIPMPHKSATHAVVSGNSDMYPNDGDAWLDDDLEEACATEALAKQGQQQIGSIAATSQYLDLFASRPPVRHTRQSQAGNSRGSLSQGGQLLDALAMDLVSTGGDLSTRTVKKWQNGEPVASVLPVPSPEEDSGMFELPVEKSQSRNALWIGDAPGAQALARHGVAGGLFTSFQGDPHLVRAGAAADEKQLGNSLSCKPSRKSSKSGSETTGDLSVVSSSALPLPQIAVSNFML